jgi:hypothetical protein
MRRLMPFLEHPFREDRVGAGEGEELDFMDFYGIGFLWNRIFMELSRFLFF